jgi:hypothetical protein
MEKDEIKNGVNKWGQIRSWRIQTNSVSLLYGRPLRIPALHPLPSLSRASLIKRMIIQGQTAKPIFSGHKNRIDCKSSSFYPYSQGAWKKGQAVSEIHELGK